MEKVKQEILNRDEKLRKRLIKTLALLGITLCVVVASGKTCEINEYSEKGSEETGNQSGNL